LIYSLALFDPTAGLKIERSRAMNSIERLREIRTYELFVFGGVPEAPESMYERDSHGYSESRSTGRGIENARSLIRRRKIALRTRIIADFKSGKFSIKAIRAKKKR